MKLRRKNSRSYETAVLEQSEISSDVVPVVGLEYPEGHLVAPLPAPKSALRAEWLLVPDHRQEKSRNPRKGSLLFWCRWWDSNPHDVAIGGF